MEIDASTAYLPDNTWFVDGLFHGMTYKDNYTRILMMTLLLTDEITDVYSDPDYPQFKYSTNASHTIHAAFSGCREGILSKKAENLVITNVCANSNVRILAVECDGAELRFDVDPSVKLALGEKTEIAFAGVIPAVSDTVVDVTVYYAMDTITPIGYRTQGFKLVNGEAVESDEEYADAEADMPFDSLINETVDNVLRSLGLKEFISMIYSIINYWVAEIIKI